jgi:hypothetical protein
MISYFIEKTIDIVILEVFWFTGLRPLSLNFDSTVTIEQSQDEMNSYLIIEKRNDKEI